MKVGTKTQSTLQPDKFSVNALGEDTYELSLCENVVETEQVIEMDGENLVEKLYEYNLTLEVNKIKSYEELVSALVSLKYSYGDEFALMKKGFRNAQDEEYLDYESYVDECKVFSRQYWLK